MQDLWSRFDQHALASWPPLERSLLADGWMAGVSGGTSNRANCAWGQAAVISRAAAVQVRDVYAAHRRRPLVRVRAEALVRTAASLEQAWGDVAVVNPTLVLHRPAGKHVPAQAPLSATDRDEWLQDHAQIAGPDPVMDRIVRSVELPSTYLAVRAEARAIAVVRVTGGASTAGVHTLLVAPDHRRQGLARRMTWAALAVLPEHEHYLHVDRDNLPALRLYEQAGFAVLGEYGYVTAAPVG